MGTTSTFQIATGKKALQIYALHLFRSSSWQNISCSCAYMQADTELQWRWPWVTTIVGNPAQYTMVQKDGAERMIQNHYFRSESLQCIYTQVIKKSIRRLNENFKLESQKRSPLLASHSSSKPRNQKYQYLGVSSSRSSWSSSSPPQKFQKKIKHQTLLVSETIDLLATANRRTTGS